MKFKSFEYRLKIREGHLDTFFHVNNAVYLQMFEEARWEILNQNNYGIDRIRQTGFGPVILEIKIKFNRELKLHDQIIIRSQIAEMKRMTSVFRQTIERDGEIACEADFVFGFFNVRERKLSEPTADWLKAVGAE